LHQN